MIDLGQPRYQDRLAEMTALLNPELIIINSLSSVHSGGQNNVEDVRSFMGYLIRLTGWAKCGLAADPPHPQALWRPAAHDELRPGHGRPERQRLHHPAGAGGVGSACGANRAGIRSQRAAGIEGAQNQPGALPGSPGFRIRIHSNLLA